MERQSHEMNDFGGQEASRNAQTTPKTPVARQSQRPVSRSSSITMREPVVQELQLTIWPFLVVAIYSALVLFPWVVYCTATNRNLYYTTDSSYDYYEREDDAMKTLAHKKILLKAASIVQAMATMLTIPVTSAICSMAWVAYIQSSKLRTKLSLRQTMTLADQGWLSPRVWSRICCNLERLGSLPFYLAFVLTCIGVAFQIFQGAVIERKLMTIPTSPYTIPIPDVAQVISDTDTFVNSNVIELQSIFQTAKQDDYEPYMWSRFNDVESQRVMRGVYGGEWNTFTRALRLIGSRNENLDEPNYYVTPLPAHSTAGTIPFAQHAPRMNTTVAYQNVTDQGFPKECAPGMNGLYTEYRYQDPESEWTYLNLAVCMPNTNISATPWTVTYDRQDVTEELYLSFNCSGSMWFQGVYKATAKTTLGYFEVPSDRNGNKAGPLLDKFFLSDRQMGYRSSKRQSDSEPMGPIDHVLVNTTQTLSPHLGPLTAVTLALFGEGSFVQTRLTQPTAYIPADRPKEFGQGWRYNNTLYSGNCMFFTPLASFMSYSGDSCVRDDRMGSDRAVVNQVVSWLANLEIEETMRRSLTTATFLANKNWLKAKGWGNRAGTVQYGSGEQMEVPFVALGSMFVGYTLLVAHLVGLFGLAFYIIARKLWVSTLGSEIMVKMGVAYAEELRHSKSKKEWKQATGSLPGFVGDAAPGEPIGKIELGAKEALSRGSMKRFECL